MSSDESSSFGEAVSANQQPSREHRMHPQPARAVFPLSNAHQYPHPYPHPHRYVRAPTERDVLVLVERENPFVRANSRGEVCAICCFVMTTVVVVVGLVVYNILARL